MIVSFPNGTCCSDMELGMTPPGWAEDAYNDGLMW